MSRRHFLEPLLRAASGASVIWNTRSGQPLATAVEAAFTSEDRRRGLLGRDVLPRGRAMVIAPTNLVHTFRMRFAIDIVFAARDGRVIKVRPAVPARRIAGAWAAFAVIELAAGEAELSDTRSGDMLEIRGH